MLRPNGDICICEECGAPFHERNNSHNRFCSRECGFVAQRKISAESRKPIYSKVYAGYCEECKQPFISKRARKHCSVDCTKSAAKSYSVRLWQDKQKALIVKRDPVTCKKCHVTFSALHGRTEFCSAKCHDAAHRVRGRGNSVIRAKRYGVPYKYFSAKKVLARDGWICQICGTPTPPELRGTYEDNAPELDHIIPLSKGGAHLPENTQCACRKCNGAKADGTVVGGVIV